MLLPNDIRQGTHGEIATAEHIGQSGDTGTNIETRTSSFAASVPENLWPGYNCSAYSSSCYRWTTFPAELGFSNSRRHSQFRAFTHLVEHVQKLTQCSLCTVSSFIPAPAAKEIIIYRSFVDKNMLHEFGRVIVKEAAKGIDNLCDCCSKKRVMFRYIFGQRYKGIKSACLEYNVSKKCGEYTACFKGTLKDGMGRDARTVLFDADESVLDISSCFPSDSPSCGIAISQVL